MFRLAGPSTLSSAARLTARGLATHVAEGATPSRLPKTRHNWSRPEIKEIFNSPLMGLVFRAASVHREHHDPSKIQLCTLMNIKSA